jgi:catechol 2,3-dioxygenase
MGIFTDKPEAMRDFYMSMLGLVVSDTGVGKYFKRRIIFMTGDPMQHHQFVLVVREPGDPPGGALFQVSFKVKSLDELREVTARAVVNGATAVKALNHGNSWSVYFRDPDGNMIEIYMDTGWHIPQPFADELVLSLSDQDIRRITDEHAKSVPGSLPQEVFAAQLAQKLAAAQGTRS